MSALSVSEFALLPLRRGVILPGRVATLPVGRAKSVELARSLSIGDQLVLATQRDPVEEQPSIEDLHHVGVIARVKDKADRGSRGLVLVVEALHRVTLEDTVAGNHWRVRVRPRPDFDTDIAETEALAESLRQRVQELAPSDKGLRNALRRAEPDAVADVVTTWVDAPQEQKLEVLAERSVPARLRLAAQIVQEAKARAELKSKVDSEVRRDLNKAQREQLLRRQLDAIRRELGELEGDDDDPLAKLKADLESGVLSDEAREVAERELRRLESLPAQSPESNVIRTYLEWIAAMPWDKRADAHTDLDEVERALEADHFGLDDVKKRILEHMAVLKLAPAARGTLLCLVGPPGVGKTSLAQSVADATGRPLVRVSLGGIRDEAEIRGHRRTYVGALPGRILSAIRKAGVKNPVIVLDELDKVGGRNWAGDPEAALLELLDPEQNDKFVDHYLEIPFDLSEVLFIATANDLGRLSAPLLDRLEVIELSGYTTDEKVAIAKEHLLPKELERHGLSPEAVTIDDEVLAVVARDYTREAGVRRLSRQIAKLLRRIALEVAKSDTASQFVIDEARVREVLGRPRYFADLAERERPAGVAAGLAWTPVGGDVLYIETTRMPGKGKVEITGQLGEVMNESARAALAYVRTHASDLGIDPSFLEGSDLHVHVPAGAIPKDGPSAGVTMFTAFASLLTERKVRPDTAMTGEATLRGRVLPVGGIKAKVLAAHRAGFERILLPKKNAPDVADVPESVQQALEILFVETMEEVFEHALLESPTPARDSDPGRDLPRNANLNPAA
ncbi:MAG: endopeptidase La [Myxococcota bacterium]